MSSRDVLSAAATARVPSCNWDADLPAAIGGTNLAPSPTAYLLGALAGCGVAFMHDTLARQFGVRIDSITAVARCSTDLRGLLGIDDASPEMGDISLDIEITTPDGAEKTGPMFEAWRERCPIFLALVRPRTVSLTTRTACDNAPQGGNHDREEHDAPSRRRISVAQCTQTVGCRIRM